MKNRRIILNLLNFTDSQIAGVGFFVKNLIPSWMDKSGEESQFTIYHSDKINPTAVFAIPAKPNITFQKVAVRHFVARIIYEQVILPFNLKDCDCYFSPTPVLPFLLKFVRPSVKSVITIHDMIPFYYPGKYSRLRTLYVKLLSKYGPKVADTVITVSQNSKEDICRIAAVRPEKVHVVYNFLSTPFQSTNRSDKQFFLTVATIEPGKNLENSLAGFKRFLKKYHLSHFKFYWLGKIGWGYTKEELDLKIAATGLQDQFILMGYVEENEKNRFLSECTALVYLSYYEGFGIPVLEGMLHNKPALVSDSSSLPEVVGQAGILCKNTDIEAIADAMFEIVTKSETFRKKIPDNLQRFERSSQLNTFMRAINA